MPRKICQLVRDLEKSGFKFEPGKGSHRNFRHPLTRAVVTLCGQPGDDAWHYQEKDVRRALANLAAAKKREKKP